MGNVMKKTLRLFALMSAAMVSVPAALGQGCALCYTTASAAGAHAQRSLDIGILVLLLPCLVLFAGVFVLLIRRAHSATF